MHQYKRVEHIECPPNFDDYDLVIQHIQRKFGKFNPDDESVTLPPRDLDAAEALVYWLRGYGPNPLDPLREDSRRHPLYPFDESRLRDADFDGWEEYHPRNSEVPFVYFRHDFYPTASFQPPGDYGVARAYLSDNPADEYVHPDSFQLIAPGADGHYGTGGSFPSGEGFAAEDWDNFANFSNGDTFRHAAD